MVQHEKSSCQKDSLPAVGHDASGFVFSFGLQAAAANDSVVLTLVSNSDINPLIRFYAMKENGFDKGDSFKVEFEREGRHQADAR